ncbi:MAG: leucine-rich repeat domain-containing protein [Lachnospiraceae bacterium]
MPLVQAKCTNCGANLQVDATKDAAVCEHCNATYVVEKAVNNYNMTNNISAAVVNIYGGNSADFIIRAGKLEKYTGATTEVIIPNSVIEIGERAFEGCSSLSSVHVPDGVVSIGAYAFGDCKRLTSIRLSNTLTDIEHNAFQNTGLTSITIPTSVERIGFEVFLGCCNLVNIAIPSGVTITCELAKDGMFSECTDIKNITLAAGVKIIYKYSLYNENHTEEVVIPEDQNLTSLTYKQLWAIANVFVFALFWAPGAPPDVIINNISIKQILEQRREVEQLHDSPPSQSGCYIATAVYGSYDSPEVLVLRRFRDETLAKIAIGRLFISIYYYLSPPLAEKMKKAPKLNALLRHLLNKFIARISEQ